MPRARACAVGLRTDNDENRQLTTDASFENWRQRRCRCNADDAHDAMMMRQKKIDTRRKRKEKGNLLERRHRAVTTLLHYKRISPRDPRMKGGEDEKEQEVKLSRFLTNE